MSLSKWERFVLSCKSNRSKIHNRTNFIKITDKLGFKLFCCLSWGCSPPIFPPDYFPPCCPPGIMSASNTSYLLMPVTFEIHPYDYGLVNYCVNGGGGGGGHPPLCVHTHACVRAYVPLFYLECASVFVCVSVCVSVCFPPSPLPILCFLLALIHTRERSQNNLLNLHKDEIGVTVPCTECAVEGTKICGHKFVFLGKCVSVCV